MTDDEKKDGEVISLDEARKKAEGAKPEEPAEAQPNPFEPVVTAIAVELAKLADKDGVVHVGGEDEASRARTAAVVRGLGVGIGNALAEAFAKWAEKIQTPPADAPTDDKDKPKS
jgi:hypothetical protein